MNFKLRPAIAMIELIFALVIMGIALMSAPMLISQSTSSGYLSSQQEAIAVAASHLSFVVSRHWDEANVVQAQPLPILRTGTDVATGLGTVPPLPNARAGTAFFAIGRHRMFLDGAGNFNFPATAPAALGRDALEVVTNDIDDFSGTQATVNLAPIGGVGGVDDYMDRQMTMITQVIYMDDRPSNVAAAGNYGGNNALLTYNIPPVNPFVPPVVPGGTSSNVKWISVNLTTGAAAQAAQVTELAKNINLYAFSCNIGGLFLESRIIP